jgi:hypothetical protein
MNRSSTREDCIGRKKPQVVRVPALKSASRKIVAENCTAVHLLGKVAPMNAQALAAHVLHALAQAQIEGRRQDLETLVQELKVRRGDIRRTVTALHREGYVDALHMRLTLKGFAVGRALTGEALPALRRPKIAAIAAA